MGFLLKTGRRGFCLEAACCFQRSRKEAEIAKKAKINLKGGDYSRSFSQTEGLTAPLICLFIQKKFISDISEGKHFVFN